MDRTSNNKLIFQFSTATDTLENWASALIRRINHSPFSHVDIVLPDGNLLGASDQGLHSPVIKGNPQGVAIRPPDYQAFGYRRQMIIETPLAPKALDFAMTQLGKPFDHQALYEFISDKFPPEARNWRDPDAWFCAELALRCEEVANMWGGDLEWPKTRVSPTDHLLLHLTDSRWINPKTFWDPIPNLKLGAHER